MTDVRLVLLAGGLLALGLMLLVAWALPAEPDLEDALGRLSPRRPPASLTPGASTSRQERLGVWAMRHLPERLWIRTPVRDLALLQIPIPRFYGEKLAFAGLGLVFPPLLTVFFNGIGLGLPVVIPAIASPALAGVLFFAPNHNASQSAREARAEFTQSLAVFIELVALERNNGSATRQAMETAAAVGDTWVYARLSAELARSRWSGDSPWDALHTLAEELAMPKLDDLADIMRLAGEEGASVYDNLRARASALRANLQSDELKRANADGERMTIPASLLGITFFAILIAPALLRMLNAA